MAEEINKTAKIKKILIVLIVLLVVGGFLVIIVRSQKKQEESFWPKYAYYESVYPTQVYGVKVTQQIIPVSENARPGIKRFIKYIVIHETDNYSKGANSKNHAHYLSYNNKTYTSWHYTVDDKEIYHHIPDDEVAYQAGNKSGNKYGIGIELCVNEDGDYDKTFDNGARLVAYLLNAYNLEIDAVKTHNDFNGKDCPHIMRKTGRWQEFLELVNTYKIAMK